MSYNSITRSWGAIPKTQSLELLDLQVSSEGPQEIEFEEKHEIFLSTTVECYATIAVSETEAEEKFDAGECILLPAGASGSFFFEDGKSLWILNPEEVEESEALNVVRYGY